MKYLIAICLACVLLFAAAISIDEIPGWYRTPTAADSARAAVRRGAAQAHRLHREYMLGDSLVALLPRQPSLVTGQSARASDSPDTVRAFAAADLAGIDPLRARIGLFIVDSDYGLYHDAAVAASLDTHHMFTGVDSAGPYCLIASTLYGNSASIGVQSVITQYRRIGELGERTVRATPHPLGACRLWAAYGAAGPGIDEWMRRGGYYFASAPAAAQTERDTTNRRGIFGSLAFAAEVDARAEACLMHDSDACVDAVLYPKRKTHPGAFAAVAAQRFDLYQPVFGRGDAAMLGRLEEEFGTERFARFWSSSMPPEQAFEASFGVPLDSWLTAWIDQYYETRDPGPVMNASTWLLTLALIGLLAGGSWVLARRRQIA